MGSRQRTILLVWLALLALTVGGMRLLGEEGIGLLVFAWLILGALAANHLLGSAVETLCASVPAEAIRNRYRLYNLLVLFSTAPVRSAGAFPEPAIARYQIDYRLAALYASMFGISALVHGLLATLA